MSDRERPIHVSLEGLEVWMRAARLRAAEAQYVAMHPDQYGHSFVVSELSAALAEAMEQLRVVSAQLRTTTEELRASKAELRSRTRTPRNESPGEADRRRSPESDD